MILLSRKENYEKKDNTQAKKSRDKTKNDLTKLAKSIYKEEIRKTVRKRVEKKLEKNFN